MSKSKNMKKLVDEIAQDIKRVADELGVPPFTMTKTKYFPNANFSEWDVRKVGGFIGIRNTYFEKDEKTDNARLYENAELRREFRKLRRDFGELDLFGERIQEVVEKIPPIKVKQYRPKQNTNGDSRTLNLVLSDLHIGSDLTVKEHNRNFGCVEEARVLAGVVKNVCKYKLDHRDQTELVVNILGDVIENELHGRSSADFLHVQTCRAMWILSQAIARFSENFKSVLVNFSFGNHGRDIAFHAKRATDVKYNAVETTIYYGVKLACRNLSNVKFNLPMTPWLSYVAQGHKVYATHGDTHLNPGNVGTKVDIKSLENQTNKINASLTNNQEYKVFVVGHVHQALVTQLSNGAYLIVNGALTPPNGFAQSLNIMESQQIQIMWETTEEQPVGDFRFINVTGIEKDKALDNIITPFKSIDVD